MTNEELWKEIRTKVALDAPKAKVTAEKSNATPYSLPWLALYNAERHSQQSLHDSRWMRNRYGSAVQALLFPNLKQKQLELVK